MEKWMCWGSIGVAGVVMALLILDLVLGFLARPIGLVFDILGIICCAILGYLSWNAVRDLN